MKKIVKTFCVILSFVCTLLFIAVIYSVQTIPDEILVVGDSDTFYSSLKSVYTIKDINFENPEKKYDLKLLNSVYVKEIDIRNTQREYVTPLGSAFGIKMYTDGIMIVRTDEVQGVNGAVSPAERAGITEGDSIIKINGKKVNGNKEVADIFSHSEGKPLRLTVKRNGTLFDTVITPVYSVNENQYRAGIWVRDSSAGIGTLTYYDSDSGIFCGLGHAVCDIDTGQILSLSDGEAVNTIIKGSYKGKIGNPGELCGIFGNISLGKIIKNTKSGVYGISDSITSTFDEIPVAMHYEVKEGDAYIISEINGEGPQKFDARIIKTFGNGNGQEKNLVLEITDETLISETGGIVQGMSGSPIIQNGMLAGAVTHVLINDPTRGYGIYAENMLNSAK